MTKGLKQMVAEAAKQAEKKKKPPVEVSGEATRALGEHVRQWAGWPTARVVFGNPLEQGWPSPWAACDHVTRTFMVNADELVLNPNRVLLTVTPFRLRQEAVLTGAMLHEAGHARHTHWKPRTPEAAAKFRHKDGTLPTKAEFALASLMEEPRVEGLMFRDADRIGAVGLGWTMRASAAQLIPTTALSMDPNLRIMDIITSWALRAGRQIALNHWTRHPLRNWVQDFSTLLHGALIAHLAEAESRGADTDVDVDARRIIDLLIEMTHVGDDRGSTMIDKARDVLTLLFPETDPDEQPEAGGGCSQPQPDSGEGEGSEDAQPEDKGGESDEDGEKGEGNTEPEDEGSGTDPGAGDSGEDEAKPEDSEPEDSEPDEGEADESSDDKPDSEQGGGNSGEQSEAEGEEAEQEPGASTSTDTESELAQALADMEAEAQGETTDEASDEADEAEEEAAKGAGSGGNSGGQGGWRMPTKEERETQKNAERFLRSLVNPSEAAKVTLDDAPAATVDGAALAAWKAGGQHSAPKFFRRTRRSVEPSPPVKIAILVDVSSSMEVLQKPSAVLSWALAAAAMDLRNFAGRGQQIESCLIHWGTTVKVIQRNGEILPGIREYPCIEGTSAMGWALDAVEEELPGFFDQTERPVNRLLVQFTDWELFGRGASVQSKISAALASGVNMLTVAPASYSPRHSDLDSILRQCPVQRGMSTLLRYNKMFPEQVWDTAAEALS